MARSFPLVPCTLTDLTAAPRQVRAYGSSLAPVSLAHPPLLQALARGLQITGKAGATVVAGDLDDPSLSAVFASPSSSRLALAQILFQLSPPDLHVVPLCAPRAAPHDPLILPWSVEPPRLADLPRDTQRLFVLPGPHLPASLDVQRIAALVADLAAADRSVLFVAHGAAHACALRLWLAVHGLRVATVVSEPPLDPRVQLLALRGCEPSMSLADRLYVEAVLESLHETDGFPEALVRLGLPLAADPDQVVLPGGLCLSLTDRCVRDAARHPLSPPLPPDLYFARPGPDSPVGARWFWLHAVGQWLDLHSAEESRDAA